MNKINRFKKIKGIGGHEGGGFAHVCPQAIAGRRGGVGAVAATVLLAVVAVGVLIFALLKFAGEIAENNDTDPSATENGGLFVKQPQLSESEKAEITAAATSLVQRNYIILRLYYLTGLQSKPEPYGNKSEDGYLTVTDDTYKTLYDVQSIVDETYVAETAEQIKTNPAGGGAVYAERADGDLGINENFRPAKEYDKIWDSPTFTLTPRSSDECDLHVKLKDKLGADVTVSVKMLRADGQWLLSEMIT